MSGCAVLHYCPRVCAPQASPRIAEFDGTACMCAPGGHPHDRILPELGAVGRRMQPPIIDHLICVRLCLGYLSGASAFNMHARARQRMHPDAHASVMCGAPSREGKCLSTSCAGSTLGRTQNPLFCSCSMASAGITGCLIHSPQYAPVLGKTFDQDEGMHMPGATAGSGLRCKTGVVGGHHVVDRRHRHSRHHRLVKPRHFFSSVCLDFLILPVPARCRRRVLLSCSVAFAAPFTPRMDRTRRFCRDSPEGGPVIRGLSVLN